MTPSIEVSFRESAAALRRLRRPSAKLLQPGLSRAAIASIETTLPFKLTRELVELYLTTNGTAAKPGATLGELSFFPGYHLLSLEDAAGAYAGMRKARQWKKGWFPFFASGAGDYYAVSCAPASRGVIGFLRGEPDQPIEYASVTAMFATLAKCFEEGAFLVKKGDFTIDDDEHRRIAIELNPRVALWKEEATAAAQGARNYEVQMMYVKAANWLAKKQKPLDALKLLEEVVSEPDQATYVYANALYSIILASEKKLRVEPARIRRMLDVCLAQPDLQGDGYLNAAFCFMLLADKGKAITSLEKAKKKRVKLKPHLADPAFAPLSTEKRFMALVKSSR